MQHPSRYLSAFPQTGLSLSTLATTLYERPISEIKLIYNQRKGMKRRGFREPRHVEFLF